MLFHVISYISYISCSCCLPISFSALILRPVSLLQFEVSKRKWCIGLAWSWDKRLWQCGGWGYPLTNAHLVDSKMDVYVSHQYGAVFRVGHKCSTWNLQTFFDWKLRNIKPKETKYSNPITSKIGCSPETGNRKWSNWQRQYPTPCGTSLRSFVVHHLSSTALPSCTRPRRNLHLGMKKSGETLNLEC